MRLQSLFSRRSGMQRLAAASLALLLLSGAQAGVLETEDPDASPNLGLMRNDAAGGLTTGHVYALAPHPQGGMIAGGDFLQTADGTARTHLLRVMPDGTLDENFEVTLTSNGAAYVNAIAVDATGIYIGGSWQNVDGIFRPTLAKLDLQGELIENWNSGLDDNDVVHALALGGGQLYVGGGIVTDDLWGLAKVDAQTGVRDVRWRAQTQTRVIAEPSGGARGSVHSLLHTGTDLIVGGNFEQIAGVPRRYIARLSLQAPAQDEPGVDEQVSVSAYQVNLSGIVYSLALDSRTQQVYAGGRFFVGQHNNLVRTDAAGIVDGSFKPNPSAGVMALVLTRGALYYGGDFRDNAGQPLNLVRTTLAGSGALDATWLPLPNDHVRALAWDAGGQRLWAGGKFATMGANARNGFARFSFAGTDLIFRDGLED
jgi:hypothetical protein